MSEKIIFLPQKATNYYLDQATEIPFVYEVLNLILCLDESLFFYLKNHYLNF